MNTISEATKLNNGQVLDIAYPIRLYNKDGDEVYYEAANGFWRKWAYNEDGKVVSVEDATGCWRKREYRDGKEVYYEDSNGYIEDNREPAEIEKIEKE